MNKHFFTLAITCSVLAGVAVGRSETASAQARSELPLEVVTVVAPRLVRHTERTPTGGRTELVSLTRRVSIGDLDLTLHEDVVELENRIKETAEEACAYLAEMFPLSSDDTPNCVRRAVEGALAQAEKAIAAAHE